MHTRPSLIFIPPHPLWADKLYAECLLAISVCLRVLAKEYPSASSISLSPSELVCSCTAFALKARFFSLFWIHSQRKYSMKVTKVSGIVMAQYRLNCGVGFTPILFDRWSTLAHSKHGVEKRADMKLPGRKNMVTTARVFIEDESR